MHNSLASRWTAYSFFACFFESLPMWNTREDGRALAHLPAGSQPEYDRLLKFTHADCNIPLWASVCADAENGLLLDATTLAVKQMYNRFGYQPKPMDGNPPDYIGQMFRFGCYLFALAAQAEAAGESPERWLCAVAELEAGFLSPTATTVAEELARHAGEEPYIHMAGLLGGYQDLDLGELPTTKLARYIDFASGAGTPIPDAPSRVVNTAGRNNCGGKCVIRAVEQDGCVLEIANDCGLANNPAVKPCLRGRAYRQTFFSPGRLRYPLRRVGKRGEGKFERISWQQAADEVAKQYLRIREAYGPGAFYVMYATGVSAAVRPDRLAKRLLALDGGFLDYYNSYSSACARFTTPYIYGDNFSGNSVPDMLNTKLLILWGHNPVETVFGSERNYYLTELRRQGTRVVVLDPRDSDTAHTRADEWIGVRPSTDSALADGMAHTIWSEGLQNQHFMDTYCLGFDEAHMPAGADPSLCYRAYLFGEADGVVKDAEWSAAICGVPADTIRRLAREYATTKPACILLGLGIQRTGNGEQAVRGCAMLACLTGNVGIPGGGAAGTGSVKTPAWPAMPIPPNPYPGVIPTFLWTKAVASHTAMTPEADGVQGVDGLADGVKFIFNLAGNTLVNQHSDINETHRILQDESLCEFILCSDVFMTPSARYADILLPAPSFFEDDNIAAPWEHGIYLLYNNKVTEPLFECRFEYWLLRELARQAGVEAAWSEGHETHQAWLRTLYNEFQRANPEFPDFEAFQRAGGYAVPDPAPYIAYAEQITDPASHPFPTPSGKIEIFSPRLHALNRPEEVPAIPRHVPCPEGPEDALRENYPLQLIGHHTKRRTHSIHDNNRRLEKLEPQRIWMHPADADARGIQDGDTAEVYNSRGRVRVPVLVTPRIMQGVVSLPQGAWYTPGHDGVDTRGSVNVLTSQRPTPLARGNPQHTNLVQVALCRG